MTCKVEGYLSLPRDTDPLDLDEIDFYEAFCGCERCAEAQRLAPVMLPELTTTGNNLLQPSG